VSLLTAGSSTPEIARLGPWFHNLHLPDGTQTAPDHRLGDFPRVKWLQLAPHLPEDLTGWRALDLGCNAGYYTFELARRGAEVVGIDADEHYLRQARWAAERFALEHRVSFRRQEMYDLLRLQEPIDLVLFMGLLYHLRHPLLALDLVAGLARRLVVVQTLTMPGDATEPPPDNLPIDERGRMRTPAWPTMAFIERRLEDDPTNWWAPSHACVEAMARSCGLELVARPGHELYVFRPHGVPPQVRRELDAVRGR
jgi:tRNA (mo5U34)-methyltransferase